MSWASPEDIYLSTSLASYLDSRFSAWLIFQLLTMFMLVELFVKNFLYVQMVLRL